MIIVTANIELAEHYDIVGNIEGESGTGSGGIKEMILTDINGNQVSLSSKYYFGSKLNQ